MHHTISGRYPLPVRGAMYDRLSKAELATLDGISSATASATLHRMGVRNTFIHGPRAMATGQRAVGNALTLQFMPQRDDIASGESQEYIESKTALWAVFDAATEGDMLVIQANGDPDTGCVGEMLVSYLKTQGGVGAVIDGCVRDWPRVSEIDLPIWASGTTPNYASQGLLFPWAYDVPVAVGGALVLPGDAIIADDDGAVVIPQQLVADLAAESSRTSEWEAFSRSRIDAGGSLRKYYPLSAEAKLEYDSWKHSSRL